NVAPGDGSANGRVDWFRTFPAHFRRFLRWRKSSPTLAGEPERSGTGRGAGRGRSRRARALFTPGARAGSDVAIRRGNKSGKPFVGGRVRRGEGIDDRWIISGVLKRRLTS